MTILLRKEWYKHVFSEGLIGLLCVTVAISLFVSFVYFPWILWIPGSLSVILLLAVGVQAVPIVKHNHRAIKEDIEREKIQAVRDVLDS